MPTPFHRARLDAELSQSEVAALAGVSQGAVSKHDRRTSVPAEIAVAARVAKAVGLSLDEMFPDAASAQYSPPRRKRSLKRQGAKRRGSAAHP